MSQPAFPQLVHINGFPQTNEPKDAGMTLRDYFAAKVLPTLAAEVYSRGQRLEDGATVPSLVAGVAYEFADAMLKAREA